MTAKEKLVHKMLQTTSDKTELNKRVLRWRKSFLEIDKLLNGEKKPKKKK